MCIVSIRERRGEEGVRGSWWRDESGGGVGSVCTCMHEKEREQGGEEQRSGGKGGCCCVYMHVIERGEVKEVGRGRWKGRENR